ncbi:MAG: DUF4418 family protein [Actinomycetota bacterium]|nr:DUF4418 family protein [Actinomycetota bacterium]
MGSDKLWKAIGVIGIIIGIVIALTPFNLVHVCSAEKMAMNSGMMMTPMSAAPTPRCNYMGTSEVFLGLLVALSGLLVLLAKAGQRNLSILLGFLGIVVILMPTNIGIGICAKTTMACHNTQAVLSILGAALILTALVGIFARQKA